MASTEEELKAIVERYKQELEGQANTDLGHAAKPQINISSKEYQDFRKDALPAHHTFYEDLCNACEKIVKINPDPKKVDALKENIRISHLDVTPEGIMSVSVLLPFAILLFGILVGFLLLNSGFLMIASVIAAGILMILLNQLPEFFANNWRLKASNQMVLCIFYVATYMRHTPNLENAIRFASDHITPPLSLDLKRVLWNVETERYESVKESLDAYLESWRKWNLEFIESFHLIEASLYEPSDDRRLALIDKALEVMLQETYEKMLHYAHNLKNPITMLHMLGIILPVLGLVILPLAVNFMGGVFWYHIALLYNFILPVVVFYMGKSVLSQRPTGYGDTDISEEIPELKKYRNIVFKIGKSELKFNPLYFAIAIGGFLFFLGMLPVILHALDPTFDITIGALSLLDYRESTDFPGKIIGPFGLGASIISLFVPLSIGLALGIYFSFKSKNVIEIRNNSKELEKEFASGLFQLGNRIADGIPLEMAFGKVARVMKGTKSGTFFEIVNSNITRTGMSVKDAIYNPKNGAITYFPSSVIKSSMEVMLQSSKKGPAVCSQALVNISEYIKEIHRVDERLRDLLADIISSMKSQISFLAPAIAGIVVGITSMISTIIGALTGQMAQLAGGLPEGAQGFDPELFGDGMPTYYFQIVVGIYVVQIVYILTITANGIENDSDKLSERYMIGKNLVRSTILYITLSCIVMLIFNLVAIQILGVTMGF